LDEIIQEFKKREEQIKLQYHLEEIRITSKQERISIKRKNLKNEEGKIEI